MKISRPVLSLILATVVGGLCLYLKVKDGGNIDFYWKPAVVVWLAVTLLAFVLKGKKRSLAWVCDQWWLQIAVPVALFFIASLLVRIHEPYPMSRREGGANQRPERNAGATPVSPSMPSAGVAHP